MTDGGLILRKIREWTSSEDKIKMVFKTADHYYMIIMPQS